jgi:uncharacterized membrane protein
VGEWSRRRQATTFGLYLIGGGIATLYLSTFAAYQIYGLLGQVPAFGFMVLVTILAGLLALLYDTKWLAVLGLVGDSSRRSFSVQGRIGRSSSWCI